MKTKADPGRYEVDSMRFSAIPPNSPPIDGRGRRRRWMRRKSDSMRVRVNRDINMETEHDYRTEIEPIGRGKFSVRHEGEILLAGTRDPEHDACRALLAHGITGTLVTRWLGSRIDSMRIDIARGATWTLRGIKVRPFVENAVPKRAGPAEISDGRPARNIGKSPPSAKRHQLAAT